MIKHIVMWRLKEEQKAENAKTMKILLEGLKGKIPELVDIEVGINQIPSNSAYDIVLYSTFQNLIDLNRYQVHPEHVKVGEFIGQVRLERVVVDYESE